ncbi:acyltransferase family protein [Aureimonas leprariae]|uniref:Acyltransferase n=1 Tax=Plantimonas leprariae TaxID=2615207 RepID=A0A7V7PQK5_9HYPH|nr:acyltransferase [Aureimonas leprariae]KAB0680382.1 acyltransferase [Aureimonas leprariae]
MTSESGPATRQARFEALDGLRGVCALMVVLLHLPLSGWLGEVRLFRHSFLFVDFFFVLSGFVIAHSYAGRLGSMGQVGRFALARWRRVYPLHLAMLLLFVAFETATLLAKGPGAAFIGGNSPNALLANLFLVHAFGTVPSLGWNYPSWSISAEFGAYLLFAFGSLLFGRRLLPVLLGLVVLAALPALAHFVGHVDTTVAFGWLRCLAGFSCGALLRLASRPPAAGPASAMARGTMLEAAAVLAVVGFVIAAGATPLSLAAPLLFTLVVAVFAREEGAVSRLLKTPECAFLGLVSYSIYMTHAFVISRLVNVGTVLEARTGLDLVETLPEGAKAFSALASPLALTAALTATIIFSAFTYRFVEVPGQRMRFSARRSMQAGAAAL